MNAEHTKAVLHQQSRLGRRVALLLAYLAENGASTIQDIGEAMPSGVKGEVMLATRQNYITMLADGKYHLRPRGSEVVSWLLGVQPEPAHWSTWEAAARVKQGRTAAVIIRRIIK